jgi:hypothetical protein
MKRLPKLPYIQNIVAHYHRQTGDWTFGNEYPAWLKQFGFSVPIYNDYLEFPDEFTEEELLLFMIRWG